MGRTLTALFSKNDPFQLAFIPLDAPSLALPMDVPRVLVGFEMVDYRAIEAPYCMLRHGRLFFIL